MSIGIDFILKATTEGFTAGMAKANNAIEDTKKSLKGFGGASLVNTIGVAGVIAGFKAVLNNAQEVRDELEKMGKPVDAATASVARYADSWDSVKKALQSTAVSGLGFFTQVGEGIGSLINRMRGVTAEQEAQRDQSAKDADRMERELKEKLLNHTELEKKATEEKKKRDDKAHDDFVKRVDKENAAYEKVNEAAAKLTEKTRKDKYELLSIDEKILSDQRDLYDVNQSIADLKKDNLHIAEDDLEIIKLQNQAYDITKSIAENTKKVEQERLEVSKKITVELKQQAGAIAGIRGGDEFGEASDAALKEVARRNRAKAQVMQTDPSNVGIGQSLEVARLILEAVNAEKELVFRSGIRLDFSRGGEQTARQGFGGDPLAFDQVFQQIVKGQTVAEQSNQTLKNIEDVLTRRGILTVPLRNAPTGP
jgi:hypothetical protein